MSGKAILALEDGTVFYGTGFGEAGTCFGEIVFNTGMTGYPEILTDPSYRGQIVAMTYPLIGNYGITEEDFESRSLFLSGFVVKEACKKPSNWRSRKSLPELLKEAGIVGLEGIDTRRLVKRIREIGAMKAGISTELAEKELIEAVRKSPGLVGRDLVREVSSEKPYDWTDGVPGQKLPDVRLKVSVLDYGVKYNILRSLVSSGCRVRVFPCGTKATEILAEKPDGVLLSNGPGDPAALPAIVQEVKNLLGRVPIFGICLGHQILGQAFGGTTYKLRFGHHGCNQPVMDLTTGKVEITSQNHGFAVEMKSLSGLPVEQTHVNLNDKTNEGLRHRELPVFSVQYHPEAAPGPHDAGYLFKRFMQWMEKGACQNSSS